MDYYPPATGTPRESPDCASAEPLPSDGNTHTTSAFSKSQLERSDQSNGWRFENSSEHNLSYLHSNSLTLLRWNSFDLQAFWQISKRLANGTESPPHPKQAPIVHQHSDGHDRGAAKFEILCWLCVFDDAITFKPFGQWVLRIGPTSYWNQKLQINSPKSSGTFWWPPHDSRLIILIWFLWAILIVSFEIES